MIKLKSKEKLIKYILSEYNKGCTLEISIYKQICEKIKFSEQDIVKLLYILEDENLISITRISPHNDLSIPCLIKMNSSCINYFEEKHQHKIQNKRDKIRTYIPITISIIALIKSFLPEITLLMKLIVRWLK